MNFISGPIKLIVFIIWDISYGFIAFLLLFVFGFAGGTIGVIIAMIPCCAIGYSLSFVESKKLPKFYWLYGLCYILLPTLLIYSSDDGDKTIQTRIIWTILMIVIYIASVIGGLVGRAKVLKEEKEGKPNI